VIGEYFRFMAITAGEVEDAEIVGMIGIGREIVEGLVEKLFQTTEVLVEFLMEVLLVHGSGGQGPGGWGY
jgi:hypothetical protein